MSDTPIYDNVENPQSEPSKPVSPKVKAATGGAAVGSALATLIGWIVELVTGVQVPEAVGLALGVVLTAGLAFAAGWNQRG